MARAASIEKGSFVMERFAWGVAIVCALWLGFAVAPLRVDRCEELHTPSPISRCDEAFDQTKECLHLAQMCIEQRDTYRNAWIGCKNECAGCVVYLEGDE